MRKLKARTLAIPLFIVGVCASFQNCDAGFHYDPSSGQLSSASSSSSDDLTGVFGMQAYSTDGASPLDTSTAMLVGSAYPIRATGSQTVNTILTWAIDNSSTATCNLNSGSTMTSEYLTCSAPGTATVVLTAIWPTGKSTQASLTYTIGSATVAPVATTGPDNVAFRIRAGTGGSPWNTVSTPIEVFVGQTLTLYNDDVVAHRIHAGGNPFPHQSDNTAPNTSSNLAIVAAHSGTANDLYDHDSATTATVYIESIDPTVVYSKETGPGSCASCHGGNVLTSAKRGSSVTSITNAIANQNQMKGIMLSAQEIKALAYILNK